MGPRNKVTVIIEKVTGRKIGLVSTLLFEEHYNNSVEMFLAGTDYKHMTDAEVSVIILDYQDFRKDELYFSTGNIVRWMDKLYIVAGYRGDMGDRTLTLLSFRNTNSSSYPSDTWPLDPRCRISSVERLATCMQDFLVTKFLNILNT